MKCQRRHTKGNMKLTENFGKGMGVICVKKSRRETTLFLQGQNVMKRRILMKLKEKDLPEEVIREVEEMPMEE